MADANDPDHQEKDIGDIIFDHYIAIFMFLPSFWFLGRARRTKQDREGRFAALQKLKDLKGTKNKVTITEVDNVYEEVDEREYSKRVQRRQEDDWIIDDGKIGFIDESHHFDSGNILLHQMEVDTLKMAVKCLMMIWVMTMLCKPKV